MFKTIIDETRQTYKKVELLEKRLNDIPRYEFKTQNLIGSKFPEKFFEINGQKFFVEIDGKPVEFYFNKGLEKSIEQK